MQTAQGPHSQILMTGGSDKGSYFIPKMITTAVFVNPKKSLLFLAYPKKSLLFFRNPKRSLCFYFTTQKIPAFFIDPKKSPLAKISDQKKSLSPPPASSLKYVSGAPGANSNANFLHENCRLDKIIISYLRPNKNICVFPVTDHS